MKKKINPLWGGRFQNKASELLKKINNSISFDYRLASEDIKVSEAYCEALFKAKLISIKEKKEIESGLKELKNELITGKFRFYDDYEDIHMNIEMALKKKLEILLEKFILEGLGMIRLQRI